MFFFRSGRLIKDMDVPVAVLAAASTMSCPTMPQWPKIHTNVIMTMDCMVEGIDT